MSNYIAHYGTPHEGAIPHSGRYPWGSGEDGYERDKWFLRHVRELKKEGLSETDIVRVLSEEQLLKDGSSTGTLRAQISIRTYRTRKFEIQRCEDLKAKGYSNQKIAEIMGLSGESQVRALLAPGVKERNEKIMNTANLLKKNLEDAKAIDITAGISSYLGISDQKLAAAVEILKEEGYAVGYTQVSQLGTQGNKTTIKFLMKPDDNTPEGFKAKYKEIAQDWANNIQLPIGFSDDGGKTYIGLDQKFPPIESIDSNRVFVIYGDKPGPNGLTGKDMDGVIALRPGVNDISLGKSDYAQVRIAVDGTHYMKGMAVYKDDIPKGYDVIYYTNKKDGTPLFADDGGVFKKTKSNDNSDPIKFFGSATRPLSYIDKNGDIHTSLINVVNEEGTWGNWSKVLSSQFLSKQPLKTAKAQLDLTYAQKVQEFEEIMSLTNPALRQVFLEKFAETCDSSAVHLKAAALPKQQTRVLLPEPTLGENEVYAPSFKDGERVALVRFPHEGTFQIPVVRVNNKNESARKMIGNRPDQDAIAIHPSTFNQMSGADADGDYVLVIPMHGDRIKASKPIKDLMEFETGIWEVPDDMKGKVKRMTDRTKGIEMGKASNLITDMTLQGCTEGEIIRAVKYSMTVIDAQKHYLDYKAAYKYYNIAQLREKYQGDPNAGASTLISKASSIEYVDKRKRDYKAEKELGTGEKVWKYTGETYNIPIKDKETGKIIGYSDKIEKSKIKSTKMYEAEDARALSSGHAMEEIYADYANSMKKLSNRARKEFYNTPNMVYSPSAKATYSKEVASLNASLNLVNKNRPLERRAQLVANAIVKAQIKDNPEIGGDELASLKGKAIAQGRRIVGSKKPQIQITDREWEAINAGAISHSKLIQILNNTDLDKLKERAMPRKENPKLTASKLATARAMAKAGYTQAEIAEKFGVSVSTLVRALKE